MTPWFRLEVAAESPTVADIYVYDAIGGWWEDEIAKWWGVDAGTTAKTFLDALAGLSADVKEVRLHVNSPGGDVFSALVIANALREQKAKGRTVVALVEGIAASAASVIIMGADTIQMADNALVMVHHPFSAQVGNASQMRKMADDLDKLTDSIIATYLWHATVDRDALVALMDAETYMDADEAIANGFATEKVEGLRAAAKFNAKALATLKVPESLRERIAAFAAAPAPTPAPVPEPEAPKAATAVEVLAACREGQCLDEAEQLLTQGATLAQVKAHVTAKVQARAAETERQRAITAACAMANQADLASSYITAGMPLDQVRAHLAIVTAKLDKVELDGHKTPDAERAGKVRAALDPVAIYAARNGRQATQ